MTDDSVPLSGSEREAPGDATVLGPVDRAAPAEVTVVVRRRAGMAPHTGAPLRREDFAAARGADPADLAAVEDFASARGLTVVSSDAARRAVVLQGSVGELADAFGVELQAYEDSRGQRFRGRSGPLHVPAALEPLVDAVLGLDDRPQARTHFRLLGDGGQVAPHAGTAAGAFLPTEVAALYDFPTGQTGRGQCIAILELGGGYQESDVRGYFEALGLPVPAVVAVGIDGAANAPTGSPSGPDGEVLLDIEVAGAVAPGARLAVYFAPNSERGFLDGVSSAVHDTTNTPTVLSISWGQAEEGWSAQARQALDQAFQDAAALGVTVCCASGDDGSRDNVGDGRAHVDFPAASPHVLACGGTRLVAAGGRISTETAWGDPAGGSTGGGISTTFPVPAWQAAAGLPPSANPGAGSGRGVPDVAGDADPATGYRVRIDGTDTVIGGTSAVAPLWAGLVALCNERRGRPLGLLNPALYGPLRAPGLRDVTSGSNGAYSAGPGWDACTGLGSPVGGALSDGLAALPGG